MNLKPDYDDPDVEEYENQQLNRISTAVFSKSRNIDSLFVNGKAYLHFVAESPRLSDALLGWGANVNILDTSGRSPLMYAVKSKHLYSKNAISLLIEKGSDVNIRDISGNTALDYAICNNTETGKFGTLMLLKHGANEFSRKHNTNLIEFLNNHIILLVMCIPLACVREHKPIWMPKDLLRLLKTFIIN